MDALRRFSQSGGAARERDKGEFLATSRTGARGTWLLEGAVAARDPHGDEEAHVGGGILTAAGVCCDELRLRNVFRIAGFDMSG